MEKRNGIHYGNGEWDTLWKRGMGLKQQLIIPMNEKTLVSRKRMVPDSTVHHIPCEIQYTGRAPVSDYFVVNSEQPVREAMLRGRLLRGKEIVMPKGIEGVFCRIV